MADKLNGEGWENMRKSFREAREAYEKDAESFWDSLPYDDKLKVFHAVVKRIYKAEIEDQGSYRYALYDVFGFGADAYMLGMDCHYFDLHNLLFDAINKQKGEENVGV